MPFWCSGQALDIQCIRLFGGTDRGFGKMEFRKSRVLKQDGQEMFARLADRSECDFAISHFNVNSKKTATIESFLPILIAPMRANPEGAITNQGCPFEIRFTRLAHDFKKSIKIEFLQQRSHMVSRIKSQSIVFVIRNDEEI